MDAARLSLYARTVSHLKAKQVAYFVLRRLLAVPSMRVDRNASVQLRGGVAMQAPLVTRMRPEGEHEFRFLNVSKAFRHGEVDWASSEMPKLWRYNLHYFDYILDAGRPAENIAALITDWTQNNPVGSGDGWEPYTVSLRLVNWIKLFLREDFSAHVQTAWLNSLYQQAQWLERNIEYHILANHYLKNGKALFFAGVFFCGADAERWLRKGLKILVEEAHEQILSDGGHYERTPMYHSIVVEDYLDILNLMVGNPGLVSPPEIGLLKKKTRAALDFLHDICLPDGSIPLFNDSAFGVASSPVALTDYAGRIIGYEPPECARGLAVSAHHSSGYFVVRNGLDMLVVDCGEVGPDYQPGHAHCDILSFELAIDGRAIVVDSGVYDYENSDLRRYVRSTRAHNTVMVDGCEQSEVWGVFRVARRARPIWATIEKIGESKARFSGSHDGFLRLAGGPVHTRNIEYEADGIWTVVDTISGKGEHQVDTFVHLHPDLNARSDGPVISLVLATGGVVAEIEVTGVSEIALEKGWYCPEFGTRRENIVIRLTSSGPLPQRLGYRIVKRAVGHWPRC
jgi:uncharacterized heparinase superfamily protein